MLIDDLVWTDQRGAVAALADVNEAMRTAYATTSARAKAAQGLFSAR
ncbi:MAG: hypothetical protein ACREDL_10015 [Bradyrhizobium sp.]